MATSESARPFCICSQYARQYAQAYSSDRRSHFGIRTYSAMITRAQEVHRVTLFPTGGGTRQGTPVKRFVAGKSPARACNANFNMPVNCFDWRGCGDVSGWHKTEMPLPKPDVRC
jgi:hypothetical protein